MLPCFQHQAQAKDMRAHDQVVMNAGTIPLKDVMMVHELCQTAQKVCKTQIEIFPAENQPSHSAAGSAENFCGETQGDGRLSDPIVSSPIISGSAGGHAWRNDVQGQDKYDFTSSSQYFRVKHENSFK